MVLRNWMWLCVVLAMAACIKEQPVHRLSSPTKISVAFIHDQGGGLLEVPAAYKKEITNSLSTRNLVFSELAQEHFAGEFGRKRDSRDRLAAVAARAGDAPLVLLVETHADFYSQLNGRFRWTVHTKLSLAKPDKLQEATVVSFTLPVTLSFDHERELAAVTASAHPVARKLSHQLDDFLAGLELSTVPVAKSASLPATPPTGIESIYFVMVDRFHNGDADNDGAIDLQDPQAFHGGDIRGLVNKLDYIKELGFNTVWISPIFAMRTEKIAEHGAFHGYWTEDLQAVEPRFGTQEEVEELARALRSRGMHLVMDMVLNHVGYETKLTEEHPEWFHSKGNIEDWNDPIELVTHDVHGLPDLAQEKPEVYEYLRAASAHWVQGLQPAGFRLDAVKHVGNDFWHRYTKDIKKIAPKGFETIGELYNGNPEYIAGGFVEGGFDTLFDFPLYFAMTDVFCKDVDVRRLASIHSLDRLYQDSSKLITFADNHDVPRVLSACGGRKPRVDALLTFLLTARGRPSLTYGTEVGLLGAGEPDNRADMQFRGGATALLITRLLAARQAHPSLLKGQDFPLMVTENRYAYLRVTNDEVALVALNLSDSSWKLSPTSITGEGTDAITGKSVAAGDVEIEAGKARVIVYGKPGKDLVKRLRDTSATRKIVIEAKAPGEELRLVGGGPELGSWLPVAAPVAVAGSDSTFRFELELPIHTTFAFKLVSRTGSEERWEKRDNRYLVVDDVQEPITLTYSKE